MIQLHLVYSGAPCTINIRDIVYFYPKNNGTRIVCGDKAWVQVMEDYNEVYEIIDAEWNKLNGINKIPEKPKKGEN